MKRLKILCVILLVIFFGSIYQGAVLPFVEGIKYGYTIAKYQIDHKQSAQDFLMMEVVAKDNNYLEDTEINLKSGDKVLIRPNNVSLLALSIAQKPFWWVILQLIFVVLSVIKLALSIWVPFLVVKIIRSTSNTENFDRLVIKRINRIGIILLTVGVLGSLLRVINIFSAQTFVDLSHYTFSYAKAINFNAIMMGVVILIMNEILIFAVKLKEEQELTI